MSEPGEDPHLPLPVGSGVAIMDVTSTIISHRVHDVTTANSWKSRCVLDIMNMDGVSTVVGDMCQFGLTTTIGPKTTPAGKGPGS